MSDSSKSDQSPQHRRYLLTRRLLTAYSDNNTDDIASRAPSIAYYRLAVIIFNTYTFQISRRGA